jgi:uncharacterized membrane protein YbhN (UPF0104 family)
VRRQFGVGLLARSVVLMGVAALLVWLMIRFELVDVGLIVGAFEKNTAFVLVTGLLQAFIFILIMFRYVLIARAFSVHLPTKTMATATFVSTAVGQWAPGALAVIEVLRAGILFGSTKGGQGLLEDTKPRLVAASLYDRLIGFFVILALGALAAVGVLVWKMAGGESGAGGVDGSMGSSGGMGGAMVPLVGLSLFSLGGALAILALPFLARWKQSHHILMAVHKMILGGGVEARLVRRVLLRLLSHAEKLRQVLATGGSQLGNFSGATLVGVVATVLMSVTLYGSALAIGSPIPFFAIVAAFPVMAIAALVPMGFAGVGGYQLVTIAVFHIFSVDARVAASASLLQNALSLIVCTLLGLAFLPAGFSQIKALLRKGDGAVDLG